MKDEYTEREKACILEIARLRASKAVLMQALAHLAYKGDEDSRKFITAAVESADNAALQVCWDDLINPDDIRWN